MNRTFSWIIPAIQQSANNTVLLSLTNLGDEYSELVQVGKTIWVGTKLTDDLIEPLSPSHRVLRREKFGILF